MEGVVDCYERKVLRHAGAFGNKLVRGLGTSQKQKIAAFGSSYRVYINPTVGAAEGCDLLLLGCSQPRTNLLPNAPAWRKTPLS